MGRRKGFWDDVEEFLEAIGKGIKWVYDNIIWVVLVLLLVNTILFFTVPGYGFFAIINGVVLILFFIKVFLEPRN